jgi:hypothetical protein
MELFLVSALHFCLLFYLVSYSDVKRRFMYQNKPSESHQLPFDQGIQRSQASVPEPIGMPSDYILHRSEGPGFVVYYVNWLI